MPMPGERSRRPKNVGAPQPQDVAAIRRKPHCDMVVGQLQVTSACGQTHTHSLARTHT